MGLTRENLLNTQASSIELNVLVMNFEMLVEIFLSFLRSCSSFV